MTEIKQPEGSDGFIPAYAFICTLAFGVILMFSSASTIVHLSIEDKVFAVTYWNYRDYITYSSRQGRAYEFVALCRSKSGEYWRCKQNRMNVAYQDLTPETPPTEQDKRIVKELKFRGVLK